MVGHLRFTRPNHSSLVEDAYSMTQALPAASIRSASIAIASLERARAPVLVRTQAGGHQSHIGLCQTGNRSPSSWSSTEQQSTSARLSAQSATYLILFRAPSGIRRQVHSPQSRRSWSFPRDGLRRTQGWAFHFTTPPVHATTTPEHIPTRACRLV